MDISKCVLPLSDDFDDGTAAFACDDVCASNNANDCSWTFEIRRVLRVGILTETVGFLSNLPVFKATATIPAARLFTTTNFSSAYKIGEKKILRLFSLQFNQF